MVFSKCQNILLFLCGFEEGKMSGKWKEKKKRKKHKKMSKNTKKKRRKKNTKTTMRKKRKKRKKRNTGKNNSKIGWRTLLTGGGD